MFRLEAERGKSAFDFNRRDATAVRVRPLRLPIFSDGVHPMSTTRSIRSDIFVVLLLASIVFLVAALVTYDPADDLAQAPDWLKKIYRPDRLVYPPTSRFAMPAASGALGSPTSSSPRWAMAPFFWSPG